MDTNVILQFQRLCDCWICPDCACENLLEDGVCSVCGAQRTAATPILRAGYEEVAPAVTPYGGGYAPVSAPASTPVRVTPTYGSVTPTPGGYTPPTSGDNSSIVAIVVVAIVIIAIILGIALS